MQGNPDYNGLSRARMIAATALGYAGFVAAAWVVSAGWTAGIDRAFVLGLRVT